MHDIVPVLFLTAIAILGWTHGALPERRGAVALLILVMLGLARLGLGGPAKGTLDMVGLSLDLAAFLFFGHLALHAWRVWPIWAASLQLLAVLAHIVRVLEIEMDPVAYLIMRSGPSYFMAVALLIGTISHIRLTRAGVNRPCWRDWSPPSHPTMQMR
ncbi:MAG: hypothetical protein U9R07_09290 [Pseudomonadota bacterium]|nr:hypothetical protein [Pseudomonadota bacterium]